MKKIEILSTILFIIILMRIVTIIVQVQEV